VILVEQSWWPAHGRFWSHLVSDVSFAELHAFAEMLGAPASTFDRDHYDLPSDWLQQALWLGAVLVPSREIVARLHGAGLRRPKHRRVGTDRSST
jgi:hypothetical protein